MVTVERPKDGESPGVVLFVDGHREFLNPMDATKFADEILKLVMDQVE